MATLILTILTLSLTELLGSATSLSKRTGTLLKRSKLSWIRTLTSCHSYLNKSSKASASVLRAWSWLLTWSRTTKNCRCSKISLTVKMRKWSVNSFAKQKTLKNYLLNSRSFWSTPSTAQIWAPQRDNSKQCTSGSTYSSMSSLPKVIWRRHRVYPFNSCVIAKLLKLVLTNLTLPQMWFFLGLKRCPRFSLRWGTV